MDDHYNWQTGPGRWISPEAARIVNKSNDLISIFPRTIKGWGSSIRRRIIPVACPGVRLSARPCPVQASDPRPLPTHHMVLRSNESFPAILDFGYLEIFVLCYSLHLPTQLKSNDVDDSSSFTVNTTIPSKSLRTITLGSSNHAKRYHIDGHWIEPDIIQHAQVTTSVLAHRWPASPAGDPGRGNVVQ